VVKRVHVQRQLVLRDEFREGPVPHHLRSRSRAADNRVGIYGPDRLDGCNV
jgi:hypothetical protein